MQNDVCGKGLRLAALATLISAAGLAGCGGGAGGNTQDSSSGAPVDSLVPAPAPVASPPVPAAAPAPEPAPLPAPGMGDPPAVPVLANDTVAVSYKSEFTNFTKITTPAPYPANTQFAVPLPAPVGAEGYTPLYAPGTPVKEVIQYSEPDGTLVTLNGFRATERHAREWGEDWFLSEADNAANNWNNADKQPGRHSTFPAFYFQNRTFGIVVRDEVPAGRSRITTYFRPNQVTMFNVGMEGFHSMNPLLQGFGWAALGGSTYIPRTTFKTGGEKKAQYCPANAGLFDCISDIVFLSPYNNDNCDPTWNPCEAKPTVPGFVNPNPAQRHPNLRVFSPGDLVEISIAVWLNQDPHDTSPKLDAGGVRYYSQEKLYVAGKGVLPWYGVMPRLNSVPLPAAALSGGTSSTSYNYSEEPFRSFQQPAENIGIANMQRFVEGRRLFHTSFRDGKHSEHPNENPVFTAHVGKLGPRFNGERCLACHAMNGRSQAPALGQPLNTLSVLTAASATAPDPTYGMNIQQERQDPSAPDYSVTVQSLQAVKTITLPGGDVVDLQKPVYAFTGPVPAQYSVRQAPQVVGMGLLEAVDEATILDLADPTDRNGDGVKGVPNWVIDPETGRKRLGRFGWKAAKGSLREQASTALMLDMGVTSPPYKTRDCQKDLASTACRTAAQNPAGIDEADLLKLVDYLSLLGVPAQRNVPTQWEGTNKRIPHAYVDAKPEVVARGLQVFNQVNCAACHRPELKTGNNHPFQELRNQTIRPYTDLLLHDMGAGLADTLSQGEAQPQMWRTPPLWGLGLLPFTAETEAEMNGQDIGHGPASRARYLHDGRARTLLEAIEWHDGEAAASRRAFEGLVKQDRDALLTFLRTL